MEENFRNSLSEVYLVIKNSESNIINKIPNNFLNFIIDNMNKDIIKINMLNRNSKKDISEDARTILALIYRDYLISDEKRAELTEKEKIKRLEYEQIVKEKYSNDKLFKNKRKIKSEDDKIHKQSTSVTEFKEKSFFRKVFDKIKNLLKNNKQS